MSTAALYFHTLRHLKPRQVAARLWSNVYRSAPDLRPAPLRRAPSGRYVEPATGEPSLESPDTFRFLSLTRRCASAADWNASDAERLWLYNLHYFDDLNAAGAPQRAQWHDQLLQRWVAENPPGLGTGWEPYPTSRRIVNWVKWSARGGVLPVQSHESLAVQARWLARRLEYHILGNHLFMNAKALLHAGLYFDGAEADEWRRCAMQILADELPEQILADGGHFELSTMYHAAALEDLLDLINVQRAYGLQVPASWTNATSSMRNWLQAMIHPDGEIAFFNDSATGIAPNAAALEAYAARLGMEPLAPLSATLLALRASGYVRASAGQATMWCDCAAVCPDYLPGHAHADTLSFELSLGAARLFVNSGTSQYGLSAERLRQRGTAAHNTVAIDRMNSSEVWGGFRVARRASCTLREAHAGPPVTIDASHDGYVRLPGRNVHRRLWQLAANGLRIEDHVSGRFGRAEAFFHLHPQVAVRQSDANTIELRVADRSLVRMQFEGAVAVQASASTWHPRFGETVPNQCVVARFQDARLITRVDWADAR